MHTLRTGMVRRAAAWILLSGIMAIPAMAQPVVIDATNKNGGFEDDPVLIDPWVPFGGGTKTVVTSPVKTGAQSLELVSPGGGFTIPEVRQSFMTGPGEIWDLSASMRIPATVPAGATFALLKIVWRDEGGADLQPLTSENDPELIGTALTGANPGVESGQINNGSPLDTWIDLQARGTAPPNTAEVLVLILIVDQNGMTVYVDDVVVLGTIVAPAPPEPPLLSIAVNGADVDLSVATQKGKEYTFGSAPDLSTTPTPLGLPAIRGTGETETVTLAGAVPTAGTKDFYFATQDDLSPAFGDILFNGDFSVGRSNIDFWEAFAIWNQPIGTFIFSSPWALPDAPVVAPGDNTASFGMNTQLALADPFWEGGFQNPISLQQAFWSPDGTKNGEVFNLYGQEVTFSGDMEITEAYGTSLVARISNTAGTSLPLGSDTDYLISGLNGSIAGTGASVLVRRLAAGNIAFVRWAENGTGFAVGETVTIPGSSIGGVDVTDDITVTVDELADNKVEIFINCLDTNNVPTPASVTVDKTSQGAGIVPFSLTTIVPASGLNSVVVGFRNTGVEGTSGEIRVSNLSFVVATPPPL